MDARRAVGGKPYVASERYEALAGDAEDRRLYYLFRRRLNMGVAQVDGLVWWEWRLLVEGLIDEVRVANGQEPIEAPASPSEARRMESERFVRAGFSTRLAEAG